MRLLTWNVRFGGIGAGILKYDPERSPENLCKVADAVLEKDADVIILTEYRDAPLTGGVIKDKLADAGYTFYCSNAGLDKNGILMAFSKSITESHDVSFANQFKIDSRKLDEIFRYRWLDMSLRDRDGMIKEITGVHVPDVRHGWAGNPEAFVRSVGYKMLVWDALLNYAGRKLEAGEDAIITGDFNTGLDFIDGPTFFLSDRMAMLKDMKNDQGQRWVDVWRMFHPSASGEDYTWYGEKNGFRLDYMFVTPGLAEKIRSVRYSHDERMSGISDHSMLIVDIDL